MFAAFKDSFPDFILYHLNVAFEIQTKDSPLTSLNSEFGSVENNRRLFFSCGYNSQITAKGKGKRAEENRVNSEYLRQ